MTAGIRTNTSLLSAVLPRVSAEGVVVAAAVHGLVQNIGDEEWIVRAEGWRRDLLILDGEGGVSHWFEFTALWAKGFDEGVSDIQADLEKLEKAGTPSAKHGYAVAFAYTVERCRLGNEDRLTRGTLDDLTDDAIKRLNLEAGAVPPLQGDVVSIDGNGAYGRARLLAWKA